MDEGTGHPPTTARDAQLGSAVARAQQGDEEAFAQAYRTVSPGLLGYLKGLVGDDAEDVASEAWLEIARDLGRFRGDGVGFRGWTATIARHRALDHLRRVRSRPRPALLDQDVIELPAPADTEGRRWRPCRRSGPSRSSWGSRASRPKPYCSGSWSASTGRRPPGCWASDPVRCGPPRTGA